MRWSGRAGFAAIAAGLLFIASPQRGHAQLRPYEPFPWMLLDGIHGSVSVGAQSLWDQPASLAGAEGRLVQVGVFQAAVRSGRVVLVARGTPWRQLTGLSLVDQPVPGTDPPGETLRDVGDFLVSTGVLLVDQPVVQSTLHFGTRLPTTDNRIGLERDETDFFATAGVRLRRPLATIAGELGVGIDGTRERDYEQSDVLIFLGELSLPAIAMDPRLQVVGHADGLSGRSIRGNEELAEARLILSTPGKVRARAVAIVGLTDASPSWGMGVEGVFNW